MQTKIFEGTFAEIQRRLSALPYAPEKRLRVVVTEPETGEAASHEPFHPTEFRNGVPLLPRRPLAEPVTLERIKRLLDTEDEELLRAY